MVYCEKPSKGCQICRKRRIEEMHGGSSALWREKDLALLTLPLSSISVTRLDRLVHNAQSRNGLALVIEMRSTCCSATNKATEVRAQRSAATRNKYSRGKSMESRTWSGPSLCPNVAPASPDSGERGKTLVILLQEFSRRMLNNMHYAISSRNTFVLRGTQSQAFWGTFYLCGTKRDPCLLCLPQRQQLR